MRSPSITLSQNPAVSLQPYDLGISRSRSKPSQPPKGWCWWFSYQDQGSNETSHFYYSHRQSKPGSPVTIMIELLLGFDLLQSIFPTSKRFIALPWVHGAEDEWKQVNKYLFKVWEDALMRKHYQPMHSESGHMSQTAEHLKRAFEETYKIVGEGRGLVPSHLKSVLATLESESFIPI